LKKKVVPDSYEEYIETIFRLGLNSDELQIKTSEIAKALEVKAPSVTEMLDKLKNRGLINYEKRKGVSLTDEGKKIGEKLLRNHRIIEYFLYFILGIKDYHDIACQLEHHFNDEMSENLYKILGNPELTLKKDPIPNILDKTNFPHLIFKEDIIKKINNSFSKLKDSIKDKEKLKLLEKEKEKLISSI